MDHKRLGLGIATVLVTATASLAGSASLTLLDAGLATDVTIDSTGVTHVLRTDSIPSGPVTIYESLMGSPFVGTDIGNGFGWAISAEGTAVAGTNTFDDELQAARWTQSGGWEVIGNLGATGGGSCNSSVAYGISADGETVAGLAYSDVCTSRAFIWTSDTGIQGLDISGTGGNRGSAISPDGSTVAGFGQSTSRSPTVWNADDGSIIYFDADADGEFGGMTLDGRTVVGTSDGPAVYWNECDGLVPIGMLVGNSAAQAIDITPDGTRIVGTSGTFAEGYRAFIWTQETGIRSLQQLLIALGVDIPQGVVLEFANAISADGTTIVGRAADPSFGSFYRAYVAKLPVPVPDPCPIDFDDDLQVGFTDLTQLLGDWGPCECPIPCLEDLDGDGQVGFTDLTGLLAGWGPCS